MTSTLSEESRRLIAEMKAKMPPETPEQKARRDARAEALAQEMCANIRAQNPNSVPETTEPQKISPFSEAIGFACRVHFYQTRKGTTEPYANHPLAVGHMLVHAGCDEDTVTAGYLHDTVEDGEKITLEMISKKFGYRVAGIVQGCSEPDKSLPWEDRKQHTIDYLRNAPLEVRLVTAADKLHNITTMIEDYATCGEGLWQRFNKGRERQEWYYRGVVKSLGSTEFKDHPLCKELTASVEKLFGKKEERRAFPATALPTMTVEDIADMAIDHWQSVNPKLCKKMAKRGQLYTEAKAAAKLTLAEMETWMLGGSTEDEAWEASQDLFIFTDPATGYRVE